MTSPNAPQKLIGTKDLAQLLGRPEAEIRRRPVPAGLRLRPVAVLAGRPLRLRLPGEVQRPDEPAAAGPRPPRPRTGGPRRLTRRPPGPRRPREPAFLGSKWALGAPILAGQPTGLPGRSGRGSDAIMRSGSAPAPRGPARTPLRFLSPTAKMTAPSRPDCQFLGTRRARILST